MFSRLLTPTRNSTQIFNMIGEQEFRRLVELANQTLREVDLIKEGLRQEYVGESPAVTSPLKLVYIAGPFRARSSWGVARNIREAEIESLKIWALGAVAICPHLNTQNFSGALEDGVWLCGDLEILRRCDAVFAIDGWHLSAGAVAEVEEARRLTIPVFHSVTSLAYEFFGLTADQVLERMHKIVR